MTIRPKRDRLAIDESAIGQAPDRLTLSRCLRTPAKALAAGTKLARRSRILPFEFLPSKRAGSFQPGVCSRNRQAASEVTQSGRDRQDEENTQPIGNREGFEQCDQKKTSQKHDHISYRDRSSARPAAVYTKDKFWIRNRDDEQANKPCQ